MSEIISPKDCKKDELIYFIEKCSHFSETEFSQEIKHYRSVKYGDLANKQFDIADKYMVEFIELLDKYKTYTKKDIPEKDIKRMLILKKEADKAYKQSEKLWQKAGIY